MPVERLGHSEAAGEDLHLRRQRRRRLGETGEDADRHARVEELAEDNAADPARRPGYEHGKKVHLIHAAHKSVTRYQLEDEEAVADAPGEGNQARLRAAQVLAVQRLLARTNWQKIADGRTAHDVHPDAVADADQAFHQLR
ncbi:hypothetical protein [Streptomyces sp. NPDC019507]|uniref:hypothetical protein n=1 Tax=Streptomyces sp. NPDC019507 TaxID=3154689 RepID=UPI0033E22FA3